MSIFDSLWDKAAAILDRAVDRVADRGRVFYRGAFLGDATLPESQRVVPLFIVYRTDTLNMEPVDEVLGQRLRVQISRQLMPLEPTVADRVQHPKLGAGWWAPAGALPTNDGRDWIFDVMAASAP